MATLYSLHATRQGPGRGGARIPDTLHFYTFGALFVLARYRRYEQDGEAFVPHYRALLAAGDSTWPKALVESVGLGFTQPAFWEGGFEVIRGMLEEPESLAACAREAHAPQA